MEKQIRETLETLYESYIVRDLAYIIGGILVLGIGYYAINDELKLIYAIDFVTENIFKFILFLLISYAVGLIAHYINAAKNKIIKKIRKKGPDIVLENTNLPILKAEIQKEWGKETLRRVERKIFTRNSSSCIEAASLIGTIIILFRLIIKFHSSDIILLLTLLLSAISSSYHKNRIDITLTQDINIFADEIKEKREGNENRG